MSEDDVWTGRKAHSARVYDYIIGGKDNYEVDQAAAEDSLKVWPGLRDSMLLNRATMRRMGHWLATEAGLRQFLDIGTGIPTEPNLHQVVQHVAPDSRIVYVDNDPVVLAHAAALMTSTAEGRTSYISADMHRPEALLDHPDLHATIDLGRPVGLTIIAMLQFVEDARGLIESLTGHLVSGSYLALTVPTHELAPESAALARTYTDLGIPMYLRGRAEIEGWLGGFEVLDPGVVPMSRWRPEPGDPVLPDDATNMYAVVARKP
ncbi:SAM-dependent methyltransferase [Streptomyces sp. NPDC050560]|uniref:SAM-dependent methyltransferase n=1 Tax=Streptomyces sp. NPDC050560 TaxID=3365630 RepID=UPI0037B9EE18